MENTKFGKTIAAALTLVALGASAGCAAISYKPETGEFRYHNWKRFEASAYQKEADGTETWLEVRSDPDPWTRALESAFRAGMDAGHAGATGVAP